MPAAAHRTLAVLAALTAAPGPRTLAQLTADTGVPRVSLVRLLAALEEEGGVVTDAAGRYSPSLLPWTIAAGTVSRGGVRDVAFPTLRTSRTACPRTSTSACPRSRRASSSKA
ncbi:MAG: helix-turn-helix domain-containing protein [Thermoflexaceae bacterium]|nr:helix-turn-helix domain-containing protein [Thermoflexaceae bacterium]